MTMSRLVLLCAFVFTGSLSMAQVSRMTKDQIRSVFQEKLEKAYGKDFLLTAQYNDKGVMRKCTFSYDEGRISVGFTVDKSRVKPSYSADLTSQIPFDESIMRNAKVVADKNYISIATKSSKWDSGNILSAIFSLGKQVNTEDHAIEIRMHYDQNANLKTFEYIAINKDDASKNIRVIAVPATIKRFTY